MVRSLFLSLLAMLLVLSAQLCLGDARQLKEAAHGDVVTTAGGGVVPAEFSLPPFPDFPFPPFPDFPLPPFPDFPLPPFPDLPFPPFPDFPLPPLPLVPSQPVKPQPPPSGFAAAPGSKPSPP